MIATRCCTYIYSAHIAIYNENKTSVNITETHLFHNIIYVDWYLTYRHCLQ